jgi:BlaI family transcriptional regulator, penicillinase repressor
MSQVTETELAILKLLWAGGEQTARQIAESLYSQGSAAEIGAVHSLLSRLEKKRLVRRSRRTHPHRFVARASIEEVAGGELEAIADKLSEGSMAPFLMHLISNGKLTPQEADEIRELLKSYRPAQG